MKVVGTSGLSFTRSRRLKETNSSTRKLFSRQVEFRGNHRRNCELFQIRGLFFHFYAYPQNDVLWLSGIIESDECNVLGNFGFHSQGVTYAIVKLSYKLGFVKKTIESRGIGIFGRCCWNSQRVESLIWPSIKTSLPFQTMPPCWSVYGSPTKCTKLKTTRPQIIWKMSVLQSRRCSANMILI